MVLDVDNNKNNINNVHESDKKICKCINITIYINKYIYINLYSKTTYICTQIKGKEFV